MKPIILMLLSIYTLSACSSASNRSDSKVNTSQYAADRDRTAKIEKSMQEEQIKRNRIFQEKAASIGCNKHALEASKMYFSMAKDYYGTSSTVITESPESWSVIAAQACVSGYDAGVTNQPKSLIDQHLYSIRFNFTNPFQYKAVADSMYWGYGRSMR